MILGNSSAGVREAPVYGVPSINVGSRQDGRAKLPSVIDVPDNRKAIAEAINNPPPRVPTSVFGKGESAKWFTFILSQKGFWNTPRQKRFWEGEQ
jgi:UDP-N-acetylglucosamine 2-epimerase (hydrolysing)